MHTANKPLASAVFAVRPIGLRTRSRAARVCRARPAAAKAQSKPDAMTLLLDCDGVLADTEAEGHRVSFNEAFKQKGQCVKAITVKRLPVKLAKLPLEFSGLEFQWTVEEYGHLLAIGGGKERMTHYFSVRISVKTPCFSGRPICVRTDHI